MQPGRERGVEARETRFGDEGGEVVGGCFWGLAMHYSCSGCGMDCTMTAGLFGGEGREEVDGNGREIYPQKQHGFKQLPRFAGG